MDRPKCAHAGRADGDATRVGNQTAFHQGNLEQMRNSLKITAALSLSLLSFGCNGSNEDDGTGDDGFNTDFTTGSSTATTTDSTGTTDSSTSAETTGDGDGDSGGTGGPGDDCEVDDDCDSTLNLECDPNTKKCVVDCGNASVMLEAVPPPVMLVLDKSGSMVTNSWDHDGDAGTPVETRWKTLHRVTTFVLNNFENGIDFGAQLFPSTAACPGANCYNADACIVSNTPEVSPASANGSAILAGIPGADADNTQIEGGTPAADGIRSALAVLQGLPAEPAPAMILITDGAANCKTGEVCEGLTNCPLLEEYDTDLPVVVGDAFNNDGISTYVIGIDIVDELVGVGTGNGTPEANPYERLNEVAIAGGQPRPGADKFYNATNEAELQMALEAIVGEVASCQIDLTEPPNSPPSAEQINLVEFFIGGNMVPKLNISEAECEAGAEDGWIWVGTPGEVVLFCGSFCADLKSTGNVSGEYKCPGAG